MVHKFSRKARTYMLAYSHRRKWLNDNGEYDEWGCAMNENLAKAYKVIVVQEALRASL